jgi:hypothetical protein
MMPATKGHRRLRVGDSRSLNTSRAISTEKKASNSYCFSSRDQITNEGLDAHIAIPTRATNRGTRRVRITRYANGTQATPQSIGSRRKPTSAGDMRLAVSFVLIANNGAIGRSACRSNSDADRFVMLLATAASSIQRLRPPIPQQRTNAAQPSISVNNTQNVPRFVVFMSSADLCRTLARLEPHKVRIFCPQQFGKTRIRYVATNVNLHR